MANCSRHIIDELLGAVRRMKTFSELQTREERQEGFTRLERIAKVLLTGSHSNHTAIQDLADTLEQTKNELLMLKVEVHKPKETDLETTNHNLSKALKDALRSRDMHKDHAQRLTEQVKYLRARLQHSEADLVANTAKLAERNEVLFSILQDKRDTYDEISHLTSRCETLEAATVLMSGGPGYHQCKVCFIEESDAMFPCGHVACCMSCAEQLPTLPFSDSVRCPMCRTEGEYKKVYFG